MTYWHLRLWKNRVVAVISRTTQMMWRRFGYSHPLMENWYAFIEYLMTLTLLQSKRHLSGLQPDYDPENYRVAANIVVMRRDLHALFWDNAFSFDPTVCSTDFFLCC